MCIKYENNITLFCYGFIMLLIRYTGGADRLRPEELGHMMRSKDNIDTTCRIIVFIYVFILLNNA